MNKLIIIRGLPGSGKSSVAAQLASVNTDAVVFSTDEFFMKDGEYKFVKKFLHDAHHWNQMRFQRAVENSVPCIIIDNTNSTLQEVKNYSDYAAYQGYVIELAEPNSPWWIEHRHMFYAKKENKKALKKFAQTLATKTTHGVPFWTIERMMWRWQEINPDQLGVI